MPPLLVSKREDGRLSLLGWQSESSLYFRIFGHTAQVEQVAAMQGIDLDSVVDL